MIMEPPTNQAEFGSALRLAVVGLCVSQEIVNFAVCVSTNNVMIVFTLQTAAIPKNARDRYSTVMMTRMKQWYPEYCGKMLKFSVLTSQHIRHLDSDCLLETGSTTITPREYVVFILLDNEPFQVSTVIIRDTEKLTWMQGEEELATILNIHQLPEFLPAFT
jgi:hypothetical protein